MRHHMKIKLEVFGQMVMKGYIYRGRKPVHWSLSSRTALAEAELEYSENHVSKSIYAAFKITNPSKPGLLEEFLPNLCLAIWTTTLWTIPANAGELCSLFLLIVVHIDESLLILSDAFQMQYLLEICLLMQYCSISTAGFAVIAMIVGILISAVIQHSEARSGGVSCRGAGHGCPSHAAGVAALRPAASTRATRHGHPSRTVENIFVLSFQLLLQSH
ncbi:hypothetical protein ABZP36_007384 [Zizania latifolia]